MSRVKTNFRLSVEQVESRQMLSTAAPLEYMPPSRAGYIANIGNGFVGEHALTAQTVYLSSLANTTGKLLKIEDVGATFRGRSNFDKTSKMVGSGRILFWTQDR